MKYIIYNLFNYLFRRGEFEFNNIDFSHYNFKEIKIKLYPKFKLSIEKNENGLIATFCSFQTTLIIFYDSNGNFLQILKETWK
jgi:hypothetical protein